MIADSMKDLDDEEISDTEDPDLLVIHAKYFYFHYACIPINDTLLNCI